MRLAAMTWPQVEAYFAASDLVILAVGSIECHGRHLPLGTDTLIPDHILCHVEALRGDILIAPTVPYGACDTFREFPGTVDLGDALLLQLLSRITDSLYAHGARRFVILNGHGGNVRAIHQVGHDLYRRGALLSCLNWWKNVWDINPAWKGGHGGGEETAAILAINPSMVDTDALAGPLSLRDVSPDLPATHFSTVSFQGVSVDLPRPTAALTGNGWVGEDHPQTATAEWGTEMLDAFAHFMVAFLSAFERAPLP